MTDLTPAQQVVWIIAAAFPVPSWEPETVKLYADRLGNLPAAALRAAALEWIDTQTDRPTVAALRTATLNMARRMETQRRRQLRQQARPAELEPADPVAVRKLLADVRERLEHKSTALVPLRVVR